MDNKVITGMYEITKDQDCIELKENGCISIPNTVNEITIKKLINNKKNPCIYEYEFLITGEDGADADYGSGETGKNGQDGGTVKITVEDLVGDILIKASGGNGGAGGKGHSGINGGDGGSGGKGGNGAKVEFIYSKADAESTSYADVYSFTGGSGGKGGSGGDCSGGSGKGGEFGKEQKGTQGAKFGSGGDSGKNGADSEVIIRHPDSGCSINGIECEMKTNSFAEASHVRMIDFGDDRDFRLYLQEHGGERTLKKFPHFWDAILNTRKKSIFAKQQGKNSVNENMEIQAVIPDLKLINVSKANRDFESDRIDESDICRFNGLVQTSFANSSLNVSEDDAPTAIAHKLLVKIVDTKGQSIGREELFDMSKMKPDLSKYNSSAHPRIELAGRTFRMKGNITYILDDGSVAAADLKSNPATVELDSELASYLHTIKIKEPHWKNNKTSGDIVFLYGRTPSSCPPKYDDADYYDEDGPYHKNQFSPSGKLHTIMPISGTISLNNFMGGEVTGAKFGSYVEEDGSTYERFNLYYKLSGNRAAVAKQRPDIADNDLGQKFANEKEKCLVYDNTNNTVTFDVKLPLAGGLCDYDWNNNLSGGFMDDSSHKCYMSGCFMLDVEHKDFFGTVSTYSINIFSVDALSSGGDQTEFFISAPGENTVYIPPIVIYWGCHAKDTIIKTADGSEKRADEIIIGDKLSAFGGKTVTVANILIGMDSEIYNVTTSDGNNIRLSGGHAMKVYDESNPDGKRVIVRRLNIGDKLMTPYGNSEVTEVSVMPYNDRVYNFTFEEDKLPNYIEANGYWSGDFYAQNEEDKTTRELSEEAKALAADIEEFARQRNANAK